MKSEKSDFTQGSILKKLVLFMLPILGALVLQAAYGAVDLLVVGHFGSTSGLSAVSTGSQVLNLVTFVVIQFAMGITVLIARYLGEKRPQYIGQVIGGAVVVFALISAALFVVMVGFARPISVLMQAPAEAVDLTASYVRICGGGIFFIVAYNLLSAIFRGLGDSKSPLLFVLVACIVNVFGDLALVAGLHMDAAGAAIATVAAQAVSVVCAVIMLLKKKLPFRLQKSDFRLNLQCRKFLGIGLPLALQEFLTQLSFLALCAFVNRLGLEASSGYGVACKIVNFAMLIPSALMQSMAAFVSQNIGAGNPKRAKHSMFTGNRHRSGVRLCGVCAGVAERRPAVQCLHHRSGRHCQRLCLPERLCPRDHRHGGAVQHGGLLQRQQQDRLGHGAGPGADPAGASAHGLLHEHPAKRQPDQHRSGSTHLHPRGRCAECVLLSVPRAEGTQAAGKNRRCRQRRRGGVKKQRNTLNAFLAIKNKHLTFLESDFIL